MVRCEYVATADGESVGHTESEVVENNMVRCNATATRVIRPSGFKESLRGISRNQGGRAKRAVCEAHGEYLVASDERPDGARNWEFDAAEPDTLVKVK